MRYLIGAAVFMTVFVLLLPGCSDNGTPVGADGTSGKLIEYGVYGHVYHPVVPPSGYEGVHCGAFCKDCATGVGPYDVTESDGSYGCYDDEFVNHDDHLMYVRLAVWDGEGWKLGSTDDFTFSLPQTEAPDAYL